MASDAYFDYAEYLKYVENLGIAADEFNMWLRSFLLQQAQRVVAEAKKRQRAVGAIDTGAMINSWSIGSQKVVLTNARGKSKSGGQKVKIDTSKSQVADISVVGDNLEVTIYNPMEYASFIEFGQRSYQGKFILTISMHTVQSALPKRFQSEFVKFLKNRGLV